MWSCLRLHDIKIYDCMALMMFSNGDMLRECVGGRVGEVDPRPDK